MANSEGYLPTGSYRGSDSVTGGSPEHSGSERQEGQLPTREGEPALPASPPRSPGEDLERVVQRSIPIVPLSPAPPLETSCPEDFGPRTRQQRMASAVLQGGFLTLPSEFGDTEGDWQTIQSTNPFDVLFLDYRCADRITPDIVERHRQLIGGFWREKVRTMSQGANRLAIAKKYGGPQADENRIRAFPDLVERAFHRLSTRQRIEETFQEIVQNQRRLALEKIESRLHDFLMDHALHPQETQALFAMADREEVPRAVVAALVLEKVERMGLRPGESVGGTSAEEQLLSTTWTDPSQNQPAALPMPQPRNWWWVPAMLLVLLVVSLMIWRTVHPPVLPAEKPPKDGISTAAPIKPPDQLSQPSPPVSTVKRQPPSSPPASVAKLKEVRSELEAISNLVASDPEGARLRANRLGARLAGEPAALFSSEKRRLAEIQSRIVVMLAESKHQAELDAIRRETENQVAQNRVKDLEDRLGRAERFLMTSNFEAAQSLAQELLLEADLPAGLEIRARRVVLDAEESAKRVEMAAWEARLAEIESLKQKGIFSEALAKAESLANEHGAPPGVVARARRLGAEALNSLQEIMKKATVKSKTVRSSRNKDGGG